MYKAACRNYVAEIIKYKLLIDDRFSQVAVDEDECSRKIHSNQILLRKYLTTNICSYLKQQLKTIYFEASKAAMYPKSGLVRFYPIKCPYTLEQIIGKEEY